MSDLDVWNVPSEKRERITLHDVARHVGVSKSTVSLVLQNSSSVSEKTREQVLRAIDETGYVYNRRAAALRQSSQSDFIGVLVNQMNLPYIGELMGHLERDTLSKGLVPMFASCGDQLDRQERLVQLYMEHNVGGFILCPAPKTSSSWLERLWRSGRPLVQVMREVPFSQLPSVVAENRKGVYSATRHLIALGHQRIAFIGGSEDVSDYHERLAGYMDAMDEAGLNIPSGYIYPISQGRAAGRQALAAVLEYDARITAVVCFSDMMAYGVLSKARELGMTVGRDLAVVGFDDLADSYLTYPALTTVRVEAAGIARGALELLATYMQDQRAPIERREIPAQLIVRESCGAPQSVITRGGESR